MSKKPAMKQLIPEESAEMLTSFLGEINNNSEAIHQFLNFYTEYKIKEKLVHSEVDMMLFEYGIDDLEDGNGMEFSFDLVLQFEIPNEDEYLQLRLTLFYDADQVGEIEEFNSWSINCANLTEWEELIRKSEGYLKSKDLLPKRIEIQLSET